MGTLWGPLPSLITCWRASATHHRVKPTLVVRSLLCEARQHVIKGAAACSPSSSPSSSRSKLSQTEQIWTFPEFFQTHSENRFRNSNPDETLERRAPLRAVHVRHSGEQPVQARSSRVSKRARRLQGRRSVRSVAAARRGFQRSRAPRAGFSTPPRAGGRRWVLVAMRQPAGAGGAGGTRRGAQSTTAR